MLKTKIQEFKKWANRKDPNGTPLLKALIFQRRLPWRYKFILNHPIIFLIFKLQKERTLQSIILEKHGPKLLKEILQICDSIDIKPFLVFGTLLGYYRDGGFIKHDHDIDLGLLKRDFSKIGLLKKKMKKKNIMRKEWQCYPKYGISFFKPTLPSLNIDFWFFFKEKNNIIYVMEDKNHKKKLIFYFPLEIFKKFKKTRFLNKIDVLIPAETEKFLTISYGDWKTPKKEFDWEDDHPNLKKIIKGN